MKKLLLFSLALFYAITLFGQAPTITSFTPASGPVGTLVTVTGTNLANPTAFTIGGVTAITVSGTGTQLVGMVMPGVATGGVTITTVGGTINSAGSFTITSLSSSAYTQQGAKLVATGAVSNALQGSSVAISADGNTAVVGGNEDNNGVGADWIYTRSGNVWTQDTKLIMTGVVGRANIGAASISADGNTVLVGGGGDNSSIGAAWVFIRSAGIWSQQGSKLVGTGAIGAAGQGESVSLSADGNTAIICGGGDNSDVGAAWIFVRSGTTWVQQGAKLVGTSTSSNVLQGESCSISADGNTVMIGGIGDNSSTGAAWIFARSGGTWSQQGSKLVGTGAVGAANQGESVALSADGNTAILGGNYDNTYIGAAWVFTRSGTTWAQQGSKLVGTGVATGSYAFQGAAVSISADGNTALVGGYEDNINKGATWVFTRSGSTWAQKGLKLVGTGAIGTADQGNQVALSADGSTAIIGGKNDGSTAGTGAVWIYTAVVPPTITSISPTTGPVGTLVTITGTNLDAPTAFTIGGVTAITVSNTGTQLVGMVMPGAITGAVSATTAGGTANSSGNFTVTTPTLYPVYQQGAQILGTGTVGAAEQGWSVAVNSDGNTAIIGGPTDNSNVGAAWIYTRSSGTWTQQGAKLVGTGAIGASGQGWSVGISADGNTAVVTGHADNSGIGAAWVYTRNGTTWAQQGNKFVGSDITGAAQFGYSSSISADGNTVILGGISDNSNAGAAWIFTRSASTWSQQGAKLVGNGAVGAAQQGSSVALSADGNTVIIGGIYDNTSGATWVFTRNGSAWTQQGNKLVGTGGLGASQGSAVSLSADGNTAIVGGALDNNNVGAAWIFTRSGGSWSQQGSKLLGSAAAGAAWQGSSVSISADGKMALVGGYSDNGNIGAAWLYTRSAGVWIQQSAKLIGTGNTGASKQGQSVSLSADGSTALVGGYADNTNTGATWAYTNAPLAPTVTSISPASGAVGTLVTVTGTNLGFPTAFNIGGVPAIVISNTSTQLVGLVMPGAATGTASVTTAGGFAASTGNFTITATPYPNAQQGTKLVGPGTVGTFINVGYSTAVSADGNTAIFGAPNDNSGIGAVWIYTRSGGTWSLQSGKLIGTGAVTTGGQGTSVAISADGNTAIVGGGLDNSGVGAAWIFVRNGNTWAQQGTKLVGTGGSGPSLQGDAVSISADGNTAIIGGSNDGGSHTAASGPGAFWIFVRNSGVWTQQGLKYRGTGNINNYGAGEGQGFSVAISADGTTIIEGGSYDNSNQGAAWIFSRSGNTWTQQGAKLVGAGAIGAAQQGQSVSLSADGNTAIMGGFVDNTNVGASWIFTRTGNTWTQQGNKIVGTGSPGATKQGWTTALSADGSIAVIGGANTANTGSAWVFKRSAGNWAQIGAPFGAATKGPPSEGVSVAISADAATALIGAGGDNANIGDVYVYNYNTSAIPTITGISPAAGKVGTLVTVTGTNLASPSTFTIGGVPAITISSTSTQLVGMVMPGAVSGIVSITTPANFANSTNSFTVTPSTNNALVQQGIKLVGTGTVGSGQQGNAVAVSADGSTAIVGAYSDNSNAGSTLIYTRNSGVWTQQGSKLVGAGAIGAAQQGTSVAISADGNTALVGGYADNSKLGAAWIFTRSGGVWTQQGNKLVGTGAVGAAYEGYSVSISADGNTAVIGGQNDNTGVGAVWLFNRTNGNWTQKGAKLVGGGTVGNALQGISVSISADGNTAIVGGQGDNSNAGAAWIFTLNGGNWGQQGSKLVGTGAVGAALEGSSVSLSADGNTAIIGGLEDNGLLGSSWVFTRSGTSWAQQGNKLTANDAIGTSQQGASVSLSADGNFAIVGGLNDNSGTGAIWFYARNASIWTQQRNKILGTNTIGSSFQGQSVALSADGTTAFAGGAGDNSNIGAVWPFMAVNLPPGPTISAISPATGAVGTLVTITGTNLASPTAFTIGSAPAIIISNTSTQIVGMVMPGATVGKAVITTLGGTISSTTNFTVTPTLYPIGQSGPKLVGTGNTGASNQGNAVAVSADGNTAIIGGFNDNSNLGAAWIYTRSGSTWTQQGSKLVGTGAIGAAQQGVSVAISADGNTAIVGAYGDNSSAGAAWIYSRSGATWTQQGAKLVGTGAAGAANQGSAVAISADGNTVLIGGYFDNSSAGATWVYTRTGTTWTQQGTKLVGTGAVGAAQQGASISLSSDGNTAIIGGFSDNSGAGAAWVYTRSGATWTQQGAKLVGTGGVGAGNQGLAVAISADGNTAMVGGLSDNSAVGAAWVYTRSGITWSQQGAKLVGTGAVGAAKQGSTVALSADGNTAMIGGFANNSNQGATWVYTRSGTTWTQQGTNLIGVGAAGAAWQGFSVSLSADGSTAMAGGRSDNSGVGAAWNFSATPTPAPTITAISPASGPVGTLVTITGTNLDNAGTLNIGGVTAVTVSATSTQIVGMVMPGAATGSASISTPGGTVNSAGNFAVTATPYPIGQQGAKLVGTGAANAADQGYSVAVSADGNTAVVGGYNDYYGTGAAWIYTRSGNTWTQQGSKLVGTGAIGLAQQGQSVAISADGNTIIVGGEFDNTYIGAAWIYTRSNGIWAQQGGKLVGNDAVGQPNEGISVSLSADGNTALVGGLHDNVNQGAAWVYTRSGNTWTQQGHKLVATGATGLPFLGNTVALSGDGNTAVVSGIGDNASLGATWIFTRNGSVWAQQGTKLVGTGAVGAAVQGSAVAVSADGNTAIVGGFDDNSDQGAAWIFTRNGSTWTQQGAKLVGTGVIGGGLQGISVSISADGNTALVGGMLDNTNKGASWVFTRSGGIWTQRSKIIGSAGVGASQQGESVSLSADGTTAMIGGPSDNTNTGAVWAFSSTVPLPPTITAISPALGPVGTLVTITGSNLGSPTGFTIGGVAAITVSSTATQLVGMVMPGAVTGGMLVTTIGGSINSTSNFTVTETPYPATQQGGKLVGTGAVGAADQGWSVAVSADGNTAIVGGRNDNSNAGAAWIYVRSSGVWTQQGNKLVGTGAVGAARQGYSVAISADGNTAIVGGLYDNTLMGAAWVYNRNGSTWVQQGTKLVGTGAVGTFGEQGYSVSLSADGNTAIVGSPTDNSSAGAAWIYTRSSGIWTQLGAKLVGTGGTGSGYQGDAVALSADGNTAVVGGILDNAQQGAAWIYSRNGNTWSQQGGKLIGTGAIGAAQQGFAVSISADGNTFIESGPNDNVFTGATWVFTRSNGVWTQQSAKLVGTGPSGGEQGTSVSISADGNIAIIGGAINSNSALVYTRSAGNWALQATPLTATGAVGNPGLGNSVSISADGSTAVVGGFNDNTNIGATWAFVKGPTPAPTIASISPASGPVGTIITVTGNNFDGLSGFTIGGVNAIIISSTSNQLSGMVMPGALTGNVSVTTPGGTVNSTSNFTVKPSLYPLAQQGTKLVGTGAIGAQQGWTVAVSADGNTAMVGGVYDNGLTGAVWFYSRSGGVWSQQGTKFTSPQASGGAQYGFSLALSADGNTAIVGERFYNGGAGTAWVYTRSAGVWSQTATQLITTDAVGGAEFGYNASLSADGNTAIVSGANDNNEQGASWIFIRNGSAWTQQGTKLVATDAVGAAYQGYAVGISMDGNTAVVGGVMDNNNQGAVWIYTRNGGVWTQQGAKLIGSGSVALLSKAVQYHSVQMAIRRYLAGFMIITTRVLPGYLADAVLPGRSRALN